MNLLQHVLFILSCGVTMGTAQGNDGPIRSGPGTTTYPRDIVEPEDPCEACEKKYTYRGVKSGTFVSPGFPEEYPERTTCCYFFHAAKDGRVKIEFDYFDLEEASDNGCQFDYIAISSINEQGYKHQEYVYCGTSTPPMYVSPYSKLEIFFHSDFTKSANGFLGHYEFLDINWHPFGFSTVGCGPDYLTGYGGTIASPSYPDAYPAETGCTWLIKVKDDERVLISFIELEITSNNFCKENSLMLFDGFITPEQLPERYCGQLEHVQKDKKEFLSESSRVLVRFESGAVNPDGMAGFKAVWTAVRKTEAGDCKEFQCERLRTGRCSKSAPQLCNQHHFCIHKSLQCNEVPNCGAFDTSDETKCLKQILLMVAYIGGPIIAITVVIVLVVCCYRRHCKKDVKYAMPSDNSLTHSIASTQNSYLHVRSLDHSPRNSCVMYTTSFTDCAMPDTPEVGQKPEKPEKANNIPNSVDVEYPPMEPGVELNYKGHRKRASYHMMRELCYEDGNILIADI